jgi:hypothetical protein
MGVVARLAVDAVLVVDEELLLPHMIGVVDHLVHGGRAEARRPGRSSRRGSGTPRCTEIDVGDDEMRGLVDLVLRARVLRDRPNARAVVVNGTISSANLSAATAAATRS